MSTPELLTCGRVPGPPSSPVCPLINFGDRPLHAFGLTDGSVAIQLLRVRRMRGWRDCDAALIVAKVAGCTEAWHAKPPRSHNKPAQNDNKLTTSLPEWPLLRGRTLANFCVRRAAPMHCLCCSDSGQTELCSGQFIAAVR